MITREQYFAGKPHTPEQEAAAAVLLERNNALRAEYEQATGQTLPDCPNTGSGISGSKGGQGDGGFRLQTATTGRGNSSHKEAKGVDNFDPHDGLDTWLDQFEDGLGGNSKLEAHDLYREATGSTPGWCHTTTRAPHSGHRTFLP